LAELLIKILGKEKLPIFFDALKDIGTVFAPVKQGEKTHSFQKVDSLDMVDLDYNRTMIPPKKLFIAPEETIFTFDKEKEAYIEPEELSESLVLFGVHSCDIHALNLLERVFLEEFTDSLFSNRRKRTVIVGLSCTPDEFCFCKSTGTSFASDGFELFLHDLGDRYLVRVGSSEGYQIINENPELFLDAGDEDINQFKMVENERLGLFKKSLEMAGLQDMLDISFDDPVWKEYGDRCLGCGSCTMVCPRCRCYDVQDYIDLNLTTGERVRRWYSCMLQDHGLVAGGHNFRPSAYERIRNRFNCKGSMREDMPNCVGCGRCSVYCPADIDFLEVMKKVRGELQ
jgi:sulfhydrogenase subunit beta (sulfur reductase)